MNRARLGESKRVKEKRRRNGVAKESSSEIDESRNATCERDSERRVLNALRRIVHAVDLHSRELVQKCNVTAPQLVCLHTLAEKSPLTSRGLAEKVHVDPSTLVGILDRLEQKGLVQRRRDRQDRRSVSLTLTEQGREFIRQAPSPLQATLMVRLKRMRQVEQERLASALEEVVELMEAREVAPIPITALPRYAHEKENAPQRITGD